MTPLRVVLVHWNQAEDCLATIDRFLDREVPVRLTVVDNASAPEQMRRLVSGIDDRRADGAEIEVLPLAGNTGFGPGANAGIRRFLEQPDDGEWVALAPHDVDPFPGTLAAMLAAAAAHPMAGLMCADVGDGMSPVIDPYFGGMSVLAGGEHGWEAVDYPHGTLMMLRRDCLAEVGLFDERYFSYCEEAELALRAKRSGWEVGLVRGARVQNMHLGSSVWLVDYLQTRNTLLLVQEMSGPYHAFIRACFTVSQILKGTLWPGRRPLVYDAGARWLGLRDFLLRRFGPPPSPPGRQRSRSTATSSS
jgi:GT2 family glycosyltransferase